MSYQIEIENRIIGSSSLTGASSNLSPNVTKLPAVVQAIAANGVQIDPTIYTNASWSIGASMFINGIDTETRGADLVVKYSTDFGDFGSVDWTLSGNYTEQHVTRIASPPAQLLVGATGPEPALYSRTTAYNFENSSPTFRFLLGARWEIGKYSINLTETVNGPLRNIAQSPQTATWYATELDTTFVTDLEIAYQVNDEVKVSFGADNLFNEYPPTAPAQVRQEAAQPQLQRLRDQVLDAVSVRDQRRVLLRARCLLVLTTTGRPHAAAHCRVGVVWARALQMAAPGGVRGFWSALGLARSLQREPSHRRNPSRLNRTGKLAWRLTTWRKL